MAQFPLHIITGIYSGELTHADRPMRGALIIGNILPDMDFIPLLAVYCFNPGLALSFHRTASHSLFLPLILLILSLIQYVIFRKKNIALFLAGISAGLLTHILFDVLFWFDHVKLFWPLDLWKIDTTVSIWSFLKIHDVVRMIVARGSEFFFYGLLFYYYGHFNLSGAGDRIRLILKLFAYFSFFMFFLYFIMAFIVTPEFYDTAVYSVTSLLFAPVSLYLLWRIRGGILTPGEKL